MASFSNLEAISMFCTMTKTLVSLYVLASSAPVPVLMWRFLPFSCKRLMGSCRHPAGRLANMNTQVCECGTLRTNVTAGVSLDLCAFECINDGFGV